MSSYAPLFPKNRCASPLVRGPRTGVTIPQISISRPCNEDDGTKRPTSNSTTRLREDDDDGGNSSKRFRTDNDVLRDYIPPFFPEEVGRKYVVIRGVQPGIYCDWYAVQPLNRIHTNVASQELIQQPNLQNIPFLWYQLLKPAPCLEVL